MRGFKTKLDICDTKMKVTETEYTFLFCLLNLIIETFKIKFTVFINKSENAFILRADTLHQEFSFSLFGASLFIFLFFENYFFYNFVKVFLSSNFLFSNAHFNTCINFFFRVSYFTNTSKPWDIFIVEIPFFLSFFLIISRAFRSLFSRHFFNVRKPFTFTFLLQRFLLSRSISFTPRFTFVPGIPIF